MGFLTSTILSGIAYDAIKKGANITTNYVKQKLSNWVIDDNTIKRITYSLNNIPYSCQRSEGLIREHLDTDDDLKQSLNLFNTSLGKANNMNINQNDGIAINENYGEIIFSSNDKNDSINRLMSRAEQCIENKKKDNAIQYLNTILDEYDPYNSDAWWTLFKLEYFNFNVSKFMYYYVCKYCDIYSNEFWKMITSNQNYIYSYKYANAFQKDKYQAEFDEFKKEVKRLYKYYILDCDKQGYKRIEGVYNCKNMYYKIFSYRDQYYYICISKYSYELKKILFRNNRIYFSNICLEYNGYDQFRLFDQEKKSECSYRIYFLNKIEESKCNNFIDWKNNNESIFLDIFWKRIKPICEDKVIRINDCMNWLLNPFQNKQEFHKYIHKDILFCGLK